MTLFIMKLGFVFCVLAAWMSSSEAVTCENVSSCTPDVSHVQGATREDIQRTCRSVKAAMQCFREAMQDCRENNNIPESTILSLEAQIDNYDQILAGHCDDTEESFAQNGADAVTLSFLTCVLSLVIIHFRMVRQHH